MRDFAYEEVAGFGPWFSSDKRQDKGKGVLRFGAQSMTVRDGAHH